MSSQIEVELQETMGSDEAIANAAWTSSYDRKRRELKSDDPARVGEIVRRCVAEGHSVPLESVVFRFWIRMPVFADRQHMTHRMASHNGLSGRYRTLPSDYFEVPADVEEILFRADLRSISRLYTDACERSHDNYEHALEALKAAERRGTISNGDYKRAREIFRAVLPTAFMVERTTVMNLVSFANYQRLRNSPHAQPEIRRVAELMLQRVILRHVAPVALGALMDKGWLIGEPNHDWHEAEDPE